MRHTNILNSPMNKPDAECVDIIHDTGRHWERQTATT